MIMAIRGAAVVGFSAGKRPLLVGSTSYYSDLPEKLACSATDSPNPNTNTFITVSAKRSSSHINIPRRPHSVREHADLEQWLTRGSTAELHLQSEQESEYLIDAVLLLQKSMLEKQWNLAPKMDNKMKLIHEEEVTSSKSSARRRRIDSRRKKQQQINNDDDNNINSSSCSTEELILNNRLKGYYVKGAKASVVSDQLLSHAQVVQLSHKIQAGLLLEDRRSRLEQKLGCEPSDEQLASSLRITRATLQSKLIESSLAREKLAMSNIRLVMSIAQKYDNMGAQMPDLIQGGLIGLLRGIEKFDSSKGFKISTYVYWWIRQGVSRALVDSSRTLRLPTHLHERLGLIKNAKARLKERGITPSIDRIAESLNMSQKKVRNATEAISTIYSLDREAYPSFNGLPGETLHSYIADDRGENNPWNGVDECARKDEVDKLINETLREREREIIRLYYGLDNVCLTWEDISRRIGLSRERVRQVGLVALEKLKHAARNRRLDTMFVQH